MLWWALTKGYGSGTLRKHSRSIVRITAERSIPEFMLIPICLGLDKDNALQRLCILSNWCLIGIPAKTWSLVMVRVCWVSDWQDSMSRASTACRHQHHQSIWKKSFATSQCRRTFGCPEFSVGCSRGHQLQAVWPNVSAAGEWTGPCRDCSTSPRSRCEDLGSLEVHGNHKAWQIGKYKHRITVYIYIYMYIIYIYVWMIIYDLYALDNENQ